MILTPFIDHIPSFKPCSPITVTIITIITIIIDIIIIVIIIIIINISSTIIVYDQYWPFPSMIVVSTYQF